MRISKIGSDSRVTFTRKPNAKEMVVYTNAVNEGLRLLNKQLDIIIHSSAAPSMYKDNTGIGSLFSDTVQKELIPFLKLHGFSGIQQEPNNLRKKGDSSPYAPESSAKNIFMIPLSKLTTSKYGRILSEETLLDIIQNNPDKTRVNYDYVTEQYEKALRLAYTRFIHLGLPEQINDFKRFKSENYKKLESAAIFRILSNLYKTRWEEWQGIDRVLYSPRNDEECVLAKQRINELRNNNKDEIDYFMFQQFLVEKENAESNRIAQKTGLKIIGDSPVALPAATEWENQQLFLEGKAIGCPPDYFSKDGQRWGFRYFNPKYIFNPDGTLGKAGKILKEKYDSFFASFPGGVRIDHAIGLVDPFIYTVNSAKMTTENSGRIYSVEGEFKKTKDEYSNIFEKIVLQSAKEHGMDKSNIIAEDLGEPNKPTQDVMKKLGLSGISVTQFDYRGSVAPANNTIMIGSHDNKSFIEYTDDLFEGVKGKNVNEKSLRAKLELLFAKLSGKEIEKDEVLEHFMRKTDYLAQDTAKKSVFRHTNHRYTQKIRTDKKKFMEASFAELFASPAKRVQIFFTDFWGIGKTYNTPSTKTGNWELRIGSNFENDYYKAVSGGTAPNLAKAIATALRHRGLDRGNKDLMKNLDKSAKILDEA